MASPELLQLVENCPTGAETLIARILNIITDKGMAVLFIDVGEIQLCRVNGRLLLNYQTTRFVCHWHVGIH